MHSLFASVATIYYCLSCIILGIILSDNILSLDDNSSATTSETIGLAIEILRTDITSQMTHQMICLLLLLSRHQRATRYNGPILLRNQVDQIKWLRVFHEPLAGKCSAKLQAFLSILSQ